VQPLHSLPSVFGLLLILTPVSGFGQKTWDGGANTGNWGDAANWDTNGVPGTVALTFDAAAANNQFAIAVGSTRTATSLTFKSALGTNAFTFNGGLLSIGSGGITNLDDESQTFNSTVTVNAAQTWNAALGGLSLAGVNFNNTLTLAGSGPISVSGTLALNNSRTLTNSSSGVVTLSAVTMASNRTLTVNGVGETRILGVVTGGSITKDDAGTLLLTGANFYTGATTVNGGMLIAAHDSALGTSAAGTTVANGATLALQGGITVTGESLSIAGAGQSGAGAWRNISGANTWNGSVTLAANASIVAAGGNLTIGVNPGAGLPQSQILGIGSNTLTIDTSGGDVRVEANITGNNGNLVKTGGGTLSLGGLYNGHTGTTTVEDGTLRLFTVHEPMSSAERNVQVLTSLVIGDNVGDAGSAALVYGLPTDAIISGHRIRDNATVRINRDGRFDTRGTSEIVGAITFQGGDIVTGGGMLGITANMTALASDREASISGGTLNLGDVVRTIDTAPSASLRIESAVADGGIIKKGEGNLTLSGVNTYRGTTDIQAGTVTLRSDTALGTTHGATTVRDGAALQLENGLTSAEALTLQGSGIANTGAIRNLSGNNALSGSITLEGATRINSDAGALTLSALSGSGHAVTVGGAGNTRINGGVNTGAGATLTKDGSGTLTLAGTSSYTGLTTVNGGTLAFGSSYALGSSNAIHTTTGTVVNLDGFNQSLNMVTGTGSILFNGAELTLNGSGTFGGAFDGAGTLVLAAGSSLTLGADFSNNQLNIVLAGGALNLNGYQSTFGRLIVTGESILDFGDGGSVIQFTQTNGIDAQAILHVKNWVDTVDYFYATYSPGLQGNAPLNRIVFDGVNDEGQPWTGDDTRWLPYTDGPFNDHQITPVPEPRVYGACLMGAALSLLAWRRRRQKAAAAAAPATA
jgi:fibronectin-binding autotransporter adhesin